MSSAPEMTANPAKSGKYYGDVRKSSAGMEVKHQSDFKGAVPSGEGVLPTLINFLNSSNLSYVSGLLCGSEIILSGGKAHIGVKQKNVVALSEFVDTLAGSIGYVTGENVTVQISALE